MLGDMVNHYYLITRYMPETFGFRYDVFAGIKDNIIVQLIKRLETFSQMQYLFVLSNQISNKILFHKANSLVSFDMLVCFCDKL